MRFVLSFFMASLLVACGPAGPTTNNNGNGNNNQVGPCTNGTTQCTTGNEYQACQGGQWVTQQVCTSPNGFCTAGVGCTPCQPGINYCDGQNVISCTAQGQAGGVVETCGGDETCVSGGCTSPCLVAEQTMSYIGCDYWPTPTVNAELDPAFANNFGVVVHNDNDQPALVTVERGGNQVAQQDIPAGEIHTFALAIDTGLKLTPPDVYTAADYQSKKVAGAAYHLTSSLPVTVYQFNPLDFQVNVACTFQDPLNPQSAPCYSHSNDASLLLPTHVLSTNYIVMARQSFGVDSQGGSAYNMIPGFFAVVGTENNTQVTVHYTANTQAGDVAAASPGATETYTLNRGEVLQVLSSTSGGCSGGSSTDDCNGAGAMYSCSYCDSGADYDLTGTEITTTAPVAVFSGHDCSFVPYNYWACDHLEEQMLPLETWGKDFVVGRTEPQHAAGYPVEPNVIRIVSGADGNAITFDPAQTVGASINLNKGKWVEFEASEDFHVTSTSAIMIGQFLVGQNYYSSLADNPEYWGDPGYSLMVPTEQFRTQYTFLAPSTMTYNYVNITKKVIEGSAPVYLDGQPVSESAFGGAIGGTAWGSARVEIDGNQHTIESTEPFGIVVYGFASYTSYSYPGGLDLKFINPVQ